VQLVDDASSLEVTMLVGCGDSEQSLAELMPASTFEFDLGSGACLTEADLGGERTLTHADAGTDLLDIGSADTEALEFDVALTESTVLGDAMQHPAFDMSSISLDLAEATIAFRVKLPAVLPSAVQPVLHFEELIRRIPW
jgi:hypothetical protein